jgi:signal transduction histidine kinase
MELDDHPDAQVHQWIKGLKHTTSLMTHTAHQLMGGVSTEEASALVPMKWAFPMLLERLCRYYQRVADRKQIKIIRDIEFESPYVWSDPAAVGAAIDNLLSNALKFSASGTEVVVRLKPEQAHLVCSVEDTGPGLSLEDQKKLFRKGVRLSAKPTGGEPSTGYGLAVAKDLVEQVGGEIWCESTLGEGSCFFVRLPIYTEGMDDESRD